VESEDFSEFRRLYGTGCGANRLLMFAALGFGREREPMGRGMRDKIVSFARERALATDCALIVSAVAVAVAAQFIEPLFKKHDTLFAALMRIFG